MNHHTEPTFPFQVFENTNGHEIFRIQLYVTDEENAKSTFIGHRDDPKNIGKTFLLKKVLFAAVTILVPV